MRDIPHRKAGFEPTVVPPRSLTISSFTPIH